MGIFCLPCWLGGKGLDLYLAFKDYQWQQAEAEAAAAAAAPPAQAQMGAAAAAAAPPPQNQLPAAEVTQVTQMLARIAEAVIPGNAYQQ